MRLTLGSDDESARDSAPVTTYALPTGLATTGFVIGLVGVVCGLIMPVVTSPVLVAGTALSAIALNRVRHGSAGGRGYAIAGLVIGGLGLVTSALIVVWLAWAMRDFRLTGF